MQRDLPGDDPDGVHAARLPASRHRRAGRAHRLEPSAGGGARRTDAALPHRLPQVRGDETLQLPRRGHFRHRPRHRAAGDAVRRRADRLPAQVDAGRARIQTHPDPNGHARKQRALRMQAR